MSMAKNMKGKDLISLLDLTPEEIDQILDTASFLKRLHYTGEPFRPLQGKTLGMIFTKPSTRTRVSFQVAIYQLGGMGIYLGTDDLQLGRGETIADTARVLSRYLDGIMIRTFAHDDVVQLAEHADIPVVNGLTDLLHPTQVLADLLTLREKKGLLAGLKLTYIGDGNNVAHSLLFGCAKMGVNLTLATPAGHEPLAWVVARAKEEAARRGCQIELTDDPRAAVQGADAVYTDVWTSMGQEQEREQRLKALQPFQVNARLMAHAGEDALFLHCLPAHRGEEVTDEVMDGPQSVVFDEAENRLHVHKAILALVM
jgi:ornithine carbamoyltransferase